MATKIDWNALFARMTEADAASMRDILPRLQAWEAGMPQHREDMKVYHELLNKYTPQNKGSWIPFILAVLLFVLNLYVPLVKLPEVPIGTKLAILGVSAAFALIFTIGVKLKWRLIFVQFVSFHSACMVLIGGTWMLLSMFKTNSAIILPVVITMVVPLFESLIPLWVKQRESAEPINLWLHLTGLIANLSVEVLEGVVLAFIMTLFITPQNYGWLCAAVCCVRVLWRSFGAKGTGMLTGGTLRMLGATSAGLMGIWITYLFIK